MATDYTPPTPVQARALLARLDETSAALVQAFSAIQVSRFRGEPMDTKLRDKIAAALKEHGCELARRTLTAPGGKLYAVTVIVPADRSGAFRPLRRRAPVKIEGYRDGAA